MEEFAEALKHGLKGAPDSEFLDYDSAAHAFRRTDYEEAETTWKALLNRPAKERHYRSVWAAFMLGKLKLRANNPEAVTWMRKTRQLAKEGFADALGLAADSYGWEARSELAHDHLEQAARLYLIQLALGDDTAIVSLKSLLPGPEDLKDLGTPPPRPANEDDKEAMAKHWKEFVMWEGAHSQGWQRRARDPLLRRIVTAHLLAVETGVEFYPANDGGSSECQRWLAALEAVGLGKVEDADRLGWAAYTAGNHAEAERWLLGKRAWFEKASLTHAGSCSKKFPRER